MAAKTVAAMLVASAAFLTACGGSATVRNSTPPVPTSIAPLQRTSTAAADAAATGATAATAASTGAASATGPTAKASGAAATAAGAVSAAAAAGAAASNAATEQQFIEAMKKAGINAAGVEDQLIGAAQAACNPGDRVTVAAVAGQLIEQKRTTLPQDQVVKALRDGAHAVYCH